MIRLSALSGSTLVRGAYQHGRRGRDEFRLTAGDRHQSRLREDLTPAAPDQRGLRTEALADGRRQIAD